MNNLYSSTSSKIKNIYFVGIAGSGMSGIAEVLHNLGYKISGSDLKSNNASKRLQKLGCKINSKHLGRNVINAQAVVFSSAIDIDNPELKKARELKIPIMPRAEMLAEIMRFRFGIAISGTHGKTTTTSLITHILNTAKLDPTYIIGGILKSSGINAKLGESQYLIAEADESDASFLHLNPMISVITNIDKDHIKTYGSYNKLVKTFLDFASNLPFYGVCIVCKDDPGVIKILDKINRPLISYGLNDKSDVRAINISQNKRRIIFKVIHNKYNKSFLVNLNLIGKHNVLNTLAAISVAFELGIKIDTIKKSLKTFAGVARRLEYCGLLNIDNKNVLLFDDYGHHPNEIKEVLKSLKNSYQDKRLIVIFQLHRYSRTQDLFDDFVNILSTIDNLILLNIYSAGENKIPGISSKTIANAIFKKSNLKPILVKNLNQALKELNSIVKNNDVVLTLGAGNISALVDLFIEKYAN